MATNGHPGEPTTEEIEGILQEGIDNPLPDWQARRLIRRIAGLLARYEDESEDEIFDRLWEARQRGCGRG